jgi:hypothetical protein
VIAVGGSPVRHRRPDRAHHRLGGDVTEAIGRAWARRDGLTAHKVGRTVYDPLDQAATVERDKRVSTGGARANLTWSRLGLIICSHRPTRRSLPTAW